MRNPALIYLILFTISSHSLCAQIASSKAIVINEFMASNEQTIADQNGNFSDWIELYNQSEEAINLDGYYLSDSRDELTKSRLIGIILPPASYLILWASGYDSLRQHLNFKLNKEIDEIYLTAPDGQTIIEEVVFTNQLPDISSCRINRNWYYSEKPSPAKENNPQNCFSHLSENLQFNFIETKEGVKCEIIQSLQAEIFYTTDNSKPTRDNGKIYKEPFKVDSKTIIRAIQQGEEVYTYGESRTVYLGKTEHDLPVISLLTDPDNLWDPSIGIFVAGKHYNFNKRSGEWIRDASIEYFENNIMQAKYDVGFKIYGAGTRKLPKKSLSIIAHEPMEDHFFESNGVDFIDGFVLRAAYSNYTRFKNETVNGVNTIMGKKTLTQEMHPCVLYINGNYWGTYNLMERKNKDFIENHYKTKVVDLLDANIIQARVIKGSKEDYELLLDTLSKMDMKSPNTFEFLDKKIDLLSFCDFWIHELYSVKLDRHNNRFWRSKGDTARWRYVSYDFDAGFKKPNSKNFIKHMEDTVPAGINIFGCLMQNSEMQSIFFNRLCDYLNFGYSHDNVEKILLQFDSITRKEFTNDYERWSEEMENSQDIADQQIRKILQFILDRNEYLRSDFAAYLGYHNAVKISNPNPEKGKLWVNAYLLKGEAIYFEGMEIQLSIQANEGYEFRGWNKSNLETLENGIFKLGNYGEISPVFE